jgi:hypothetical protein
MANTEEGGRKVGETNRQKYDEKYKELYGMGFYEYIGSRGGAAKVKKGFALNKDLAREAGRAGARSPRRIKKITE